MNCSVKLFFMCSPLIKHILIYIFLKAAMKYMNEEELIYNVQLICKTL